MVFWHRYGEMVCDVEPTPVPTVETAQSYFQPFSSGLWGQMTTCSIDLKQAIPLNYRDGHNIQVRLFYFLYADGYTVESMPGGEPSFDKACTSREYYNSQCQQQREYGVGWRTFDLGAITQGFRIRGVKGYTTTPQAYQIKVEVWDMTETRLILEDSTAGDQVVYDRTFSLQPSFELCRVR
jgi:hypothetical protein